MTRRKVLKGIAKAIVGSFVSRKNDLNGYWGMGMLCPLAQNLGTSLITINLVGNNKEVESSPIVKPIAERYSSMLLDILVKATVNPSWVQQAVVAIEFGKSENCQFLQLTLGVIHLFGTWKRPLLNNFARGLN